MEWLDITGRSGASDSRRHHRLIHWATHGIALAVGLWFAFGPTIGSGFRRMQADPGDSLLNQYILEHSWKWISDSEYGAGYWSPLMFTPHTDTLAYSENLVGTSPIYWLFRLAAPPVVAFSLWMITLSAANYLAMAWFLNRWNVRPMLAALGGFLFAFGFQRVNQINHQQLLPHAFAPVALYLTWRLLGVPNVRDFGRLVVVIGWQTAASIHLGWFLIFGLALVTLAGVFVRHPAWTRLRIFLQASWRWALLFVIIGAISALALSRQYESVNQDFERPFGTVMLPKRRAWVSPPDGTVWREPLGRFCRDQSEEYRLFPGLGVCAIFAAGLGGAAFIGRNDPTMRRWVFAGGAAAIVAVLLSMNWGSGTSAWRLVHSVMPGADGIRAVTRVWTVTLLLTLASSLVGLDRLLTLLRPRWAAAAAVSIAVVVAVEQYREPVPSFDPAEFFERVEQARSVFDNCDAAYVELAPGRPYWQGHLIAMWAGLLDNRPVVNGFSGRWPCGYPDWSRTARREEVGEWLKSHHWRGRLAWIRWTDNGVQRESILLE